MKCSEYITQIKNTKDRSVNIKQLIYFNYAALTKGEMLIVSATLED